MEDRQKAAFDYLARGWQPVALCGPLHDGVGSVHRARCSSPGKAPLGPWAHLQTQQQTEEGLVRWLRQTPHANVGCCLGPVSGLMGIDLDGEEAVAEFRRRTPSAQGTPFAFYTGRGMRLLYGFDPRVENFSLGEGSNRMDVLSRRKLSVFPPSLHPSGRTYRWLKDPPRNEVLPPPPTWVLEAQHERRRTKTSNPVEAGIVIPQGKRNATLFRLASALRWHGLTGGEILSCLKLVNQRCCPPLETEELGNITVSVCSYAREEA